MPQKHTALAEILIAIEVELRKLNLWEFTPPSAGALASDQPFAIDTLNFPQWLQFIFIPRLYQLIETRAPLPTLSGVAPMAEHYFQALNVNSAALVVYLYCVDDLLLGV